MIPPSYDPISRGIPNPIYPYPYRIGMGPGPTWALGPLGPWAGPLGPWALLGPGPTWAQGPLGPWAHLGPGPTWVLALLGPGPTWALAHLGPGPTWAPGPLGPRPIFIVNIKSDIIHIWDWPWARGIPKFNISDISDDQRRGPYDGVMIGVIGSCR